MSKAVRLLSVVLLLGLPVAAQFPPVLLLNGFSQSSVPIGSTLTVTLYSNPGVPATIAFSTDPGPTLVNGLDIPLGFNGFWFVTHDGVIVPPNAQLVVTVPLPNVPAYEGLTFYAAALTIDPAYASGFGVSTGATATFTRQPSAGPDTAGFVGDRITIDGSGNRHPINGSLPQLSWSITSGPPGHQAVLQNPTTEFPTLVADDPGMYEVSCGISANGFPVGVFDTCHVSVYDVSFTGQAHGAFDPAPSQTINAQLLGPAASSFSAVGVSTTAGTTLSYSLPAGTPFTTSDLQVVTPSAQAIGRGHVIVNNAGASMAAPPTGAFGLHLKQNAIDDVEVALESELASADLQALVIGQPPVNIAYVPGLFGITTFSADVQLISLTYDPVIDLQLIPSNGTAAAVMTLTNPQMVFDVTGDIFGIGYTEQATLTMNNAVGTVVASVGVNGGVYTTTPINTNISLSGVNLSFNSGVITAFTSLFLSSIIPELESAMETVANDAFPSAFDGFLNSIPQSFDLTSLGLDMAFDFVPESLTFAPGTFTIVMAAGGHSTIPAGPPTAFYATPSAPPPFGAGVPGTGAPFSTGAVLADDAMNQAFAAAVRSGSINGDFDGTFEILGQTLDTDAGNMAFIFPGVGFEKFAPATNVVMRMGFSIAPVVETGSPTGELMCMNVADLEVDLVAQVAPGHEVSVLKLALSGVVGLDAGLDLTAGTLDLLPGAVTATASIRTAMPGVDASPIVTSLGFLLDALIPSILTGLGSIPLPDLTGTGLGLSVVDITTQGDFLSLYTN